MELWNTIVQTNTFNFVIFLLFFWWLGNYCKIGDVLTSLQQKIEKMIKDSEEAKKKSEEELLKAEDKVKNVDNEVKVILDNAEDSASRLSAKILDDAQKVSESIERNTDKIIDSEGKKIISSLTQNTAEAAVKLAQRHIEQVLKEKPQYHAKFINECINELDKVNF